MKIILPDKVKSIINILEQAGYEAFAVGGCVRDSVMGKKPHDWDITTSAMPQEVKTLFRRTIDTGIEHGTVTIMEDKEGFEVTTYRIDGEYKDSRHPLEVTFTKNLIEDLKRRDFTINAMAYNDRIGLVDEFQGMQDMERGIIRCVGNPKERFEEDALRMMRAIRFSAQLGYAIDEDTKGAIKELAPTLANISVERIQVELLKILISPNPMYLKKSYELGVTKIFLPEFDQMMETEQNNPHHCYSVGEHTLHAMNEIQADKILRLGMLFHDIGKPHTSSIDDNGRDHFYNHGSVGEELTKKILKRLHFDNQTIFLVSRIVLFHNIKIALTAKGIRRGIYKVGEDIFPLLIQIKEADSKAKSSYLKQEKLDGIAKMENLYQQVLLEKNCLSLKKLAISGKDLIAEGKTTGKEIGTTLQSLLAMVIEEPELNQKEILLKKAKELN